MIIKNTKKLVQRAIDHKEADHIRNEGYAKITGKHNGTREESWKVCAIGCLATECTLEKVSEQFVEHMEKWQHEEYTHYAGTIHGDALLMELENDFGINQYLARAAELFFEGQMWDESVCEYRFVFTEDERAEWPLRFAQALNEGADISEDDVHEYITDTQDLCFGPAYPFEKYQADEFLAWLSEQK